MAPALVILAHPRDDSFSAAVAQTALDGLRHAGHQAEKLDLYRMGFDPLLSDPEHRSYGAPGARPPDLVHLGEQLVAAERLVFVFPTWWSGPPAMLKGFFDRLLVPGLAFDVEGPEGRLRPRLTRLRSVAVLTTTGAPWHVVTLFQRQPVRRLFTRSLLPAIAPQARFRMLTLHAIDQADEKKRAAHLAAAARLMRTL